jgi:hypothetical protein
VREAAEELGRGIYQVPDAVLPLPIAGKSLEVIARERAEVVEALGGVQLRQLPLRNPGNGSEPPRRVRTAIVGGWAAAGAGARTASAAARPEARRTRT